MSVKADSVVIELEMDDKTFKASVKNLGPIMNQLTASIDQSAKSLKRMEQQQLGVARSFRDFVLTAGNLRFVMMDINDVFLRLPASILKTSGELEKTRVLMKGLSKGLTEAAREAEAASDFSYVTQMAKTAPFALSALTDSFVKLKTAGIDPTKGAMQAMVDSVAKFGGSGEALKRATVAIQQMAGKGVVSMEELRQQLGEAIPDAMQNMADGMGMSMAELAKVVSKGSVPAGAAINKMLLQMQVNNSGAASEMMKTWVGMTSRLKSEWELMALYIADSGFGDSAKKVVSDMTAALGSSEFKAFAHETSQALAGAVDSIAYVTQAIVKYRSEILLLIQAYAVYKTYTSIIQPLSQSLGKGYDNGALGARRYATAMQASMGEAAAAARASAIAQVAAQREAAANAEWAAGRLREAKQTELAHVTRVNRLLELEQANHERKMEALRNAGTANTRVGQRLAATIAENAAVLTAARGDIGRLNAEVKKHETAMYAAGNAVVGHSTKIKQLEGSTMMLTQAKAGLARMMTGTLSAAFTFMGGWIGLAITAVTALAWAWNEFGNQAEKAAARAVRAAQNVSSADDLKDSRAALSRKKEELDKAVAAESGAYVTEGSDKIKAAAKKRTDDARVAYEAAEKEFSAIQKSLASTAARDRATILDGELRQEQTEQDNRTNRKIALLREARDKEVAAVDKSDKDYAKKTQAIRNKYTDEATNAYIDGMRASQKRLQLAETEFRAKSTDVSLPVADRDAAKLTAEKVLAERNALNDRLDQAIQAQEEKVNLLNTGGKGKPKRNPEGKAVQRSPLEDLLLRLKGDRAELDAEVQTYQASAVSADKAFAEGEKIRALARGGRYDVQDKNGKNAGYNKAQVEEAAQLAEANARRRQALKAAEDFTQGAVAIEDDYKRALQMLADPLGLKSDGGKVGDFNNTLALIKPEEFKAMAAAMGGTVDDLQAKIDERRSKLATMDLTAPYRDLIESNRTLNEDLILNDRERVRAQMTGENDRFKQRIQNLINEKALAGASEAEIAKMQAALNSNVTLRAQALARATRTPMEKMADDWADSTERMQEATANWASSGVDALTTFVTTGKASFKDFATSVLSDLLKIQIQKAASGMLSTAGTAFMSAFAFADGGIMGSGGSMPLKKYAKGGIANSPQMAVFGEGSMNEAYVPLPDGRSIPVTMDGSTAAPNVTVNVINQSGTAVGAQQTGTRMDGTQMVLDVVLSAMNTPGPFRDSFKQAAQQ